VYGIYFELGSDALRDESEAVLTEIAEVMRRNPQWKLGIHGHTDAIGSDASNLDLSRRRADAVKGALVERHGIAAERLATEGYGASQPRATNETLEGRSRNRRVELVRQ
jgi:outer membrane protein OmpA-like peptidoglycan-associated protein